MKSPEPSDLKQHLQGILGELDRLSAQIRETKDLSESAELVLCLRELIKEQVEGRLHENTCIAAYATR
jgi:hypothetical protein